MRRAAETIKQREARLLCDRERISMRRATETAEENFS